LSGEFKLDISLLRRLIRNEQNRRTIEVYDLEYDVQLQEAMKILREENFRVLIQSTKDLKTLQEEAKREEELPLAS